MDLKRLSDTVKTVVCIEDETEMVDLIRLILERRGIQVVGAPTGRDGLETVRRIRPDLVLVDSKLPDMDGWELYRQIKADPELEDIKVIVITAKDQGIDDILGPHIL